MGWSAELKTTKTGGTSGPKTRRRTVAAKAKASRPPTAEPAGRHKAIPSPSAPRDDVALRLAAAEARIAELESALREAGDIASHDPLTGALNRRGLDEAFARETARARRTGQPLALGLLDLDDFKRINDRCGHALGDAALVHLTRVIAETLRPTDLCCRLGGEEFVLVMPGADRAAAKRRSEEHTSELQSHVNLVCRLLLEKKKKKHRYTYPTLRKAQLEP